MIIPIKTCLKHVIQLKLTQLDKSYILDGCLYLMRGGKGMDLGVAGSQRGPGSGWRGKIIIRIHCIKNSVSTKTLYHIQQ